MNTNSVKYVLIQIRPAILSGHIRDFPTFLKLGQGTCWIWETIKIWKICCSLHQLDCHFKWKLAVLRCNIFVALIALHKNNENLHRSVTLLFLFGFSWNFHQNVEIRNWEWYTLFWEVFELGGADIRSQTRPAYLDSNCLQWFSTDNKRAPLAGKGKS